MLRRFVKLTTFTGLGAYTTYVLKENDWDLNNIGVVRFGRAASTATRIAIDYKLSCHSLTDDSEDTLKKWSECHQRSAEKLLKLCCDNGGAFIKVGQHIAALDYLVPGEYVNVLKVLHSRAPRSNITEVKNVIHLEMGRNLDDIFEEFDEEPVGAASLAQVHRAKIRETGEVVAVKVQHPRVFRHSLVDIATMEIMFGTMSQIFPDFNFMWLANETRQNLLVELDFVNEGKNAELMTKALEKYSWIKIPKINWDLTTKRTLVMEFVEGDLISNKQSLLDQRINCRELTHRLGLAYSEMIFESGLIHCDPHPGNVIIQKNGNDSKIVLLDHGLYAKISDDFRINYCYLWMAVLKGDLKEIQRCAMNMGINKEEAALLSCIISAKPWSRIQKGLENVPDEKARKNEKNELRDNAAKHLSGISHILATVDRQLLLVLKTNDLIRSISHYLGFDERRSFLTMTRCCVNVVQQNKLSKSNSFIERFFINLQTTWILFRLSLYSMFIS